MRDYAITAVVFALILLAASPAFLGARLPGQGQLAALPSSKTSVTPKGDCSNVCYRGFIACRDCCKAQKSGVMYSKEGAEPLTYVGCNGKAVGTKSRYSFKDGKTYDEVKSAQKTETKILSPDDPRVRLTPAEQAALDRRAAVDAAERARMEDVRRGMDRTRGPNQAYYQAMQEIKLPFPEGHDPNAPRQPQRPVQTGPEGYRSPTPPATPGWGSAALRWSAFFGTIFWATPAEAPTLRQNPGTK